MGKEGLFAESEWAIERLPAIRRPEGRGITYPSVWPDGPYLLKGDKGYHMEVGNDGVATVHTAEGTVDLSELLRSEELTPLSERTPLLTIGSNRAPRQLSDKFSRLDEPTPDDLTVPVFTIEVQGLEVVYASRPSIQGSFPAVLYAGDDARNTVVKLAITFLNQRQLELMDVSERGIYERVPLPGGEVSVGDRVMPIEFYRGSGAIFTDEEGRARALSAINADGRIIPALDQADFFDLVLSHLNERGGMQALKGIYFNSWRARHRQILRSYMATPPYPHELSATIQEGKHVRKPRLLFERKMRMAGTAAVARILGELGLTTEVAVPKGFVARLRTKLSLTE